MAALKPRDDKGLPVVAGCEDFARSFKTVEEAERWLATIEKTGACRLQHRIEER